MSTSRLRKTFKYPVDDSEDDDLPREMDEEEQEKLIEELRREDDERNEVYKGILLAIPTIGATFYIPALIMSRLLSVRLISLLSMSSLVITAYILVFVPNVKSSQSKAAEYKQNFHSEGSLVRNYMSYLNGGLSVLISFNAPSFKGRRGVHEGFWLLCLLPLVTFSVIILARRLMLSVDIDELERLKYKYKGA